jgi:hypothetical protein
MSFLTFSIYSGTEKEHRRCPALDNFLNRLTRNSIKKDKYGKKKNYPEDS